MVLVPAFLCVVVVELVVSLSPVVVVVAVVGVVVSAIY